MGRPVKWKTAHTQERRGDRLLGYALTCYVVGTVERRSLKFDAAGPLPRGSTAGLKLSVIHLSPPCSPPLCSVFFVF